MRREDSKEATAAETIIEDSVGRDYGLQYLWLIAFLIPDANPQPEMSEIPVKGGVLKHRGVWHLVLPVLASRARRMTAVSHLRAAMMNL